MFRDQWARPQDLSLAQKGFGLDTKPQPGFWSSLGLSWSEPSNIAISWVSSGVGPWKLDFLCSEIKSAFFHPTEF